MGNLPKINESVLFSGRFDPLHPGHIASILRLAKAFKSVKVVFLDYKTRRFPVQYCKQVMDEIIAIAGIVNVKTEINTTHFAMITKEAWAKYGCEVYASGNLKCLRHLEIIGVKTFYTDRAYEYAASRYSVPI